MTGRLIAIVGPSGVGKDTVMAALKREVPELAIVRRYITRQADAGGEEFNSVSLARFETMSDDGAFALSWGAHGLFYGIPSDVDDILATGQDALVNLSRGILKQAIARFARVEVLSLTASMDVLQERLLARGRESASDVRNRLARGAMALPEGIRAIEIDNSGPVAATVAQCISALYPHRGALPLLPADESETC